jgi:hypothetical protein
MRFTTALFALGLLAPTALAAPIYTVVTLCTGRNLTGHCRRLAIKQAICHNLTPDLLDQVSSVQPARGMRCYFAV